MLLIELERGRAGVIQRVERAARPLSSHCPAHTEEGSGEENPDERDPEQIQPLWGGQETRCPVLEGEMASFEEADAASTSSSLTCRFSQCFESKGVHEEQSEGARTHLVDDFPVVFTACDPRRPSARTADTLTTVQFDATGEYLATGDKGGRIVVFQRDTPSGSSVRRRRARPASGDRRERCPNSRRASDTRDLERARARAPSQASIRQPCKYKVFAEFQSHEPEFDYLKSLEIEEKINQITFCRPVNGAVFLLSTNGARARAQRARARHPRPRRDRAPRHAAPPIRSCSESRPHPHPSPQIKPSNCGRSRTKDSAR